MEVNFNLNSLLHRSYHWILVHRISVRQVVMSHYCLYFVCCKLLTMTVWSAVGRIKLYWKKKKWIEWLSGVSPLHYFLILPTLFTTDMEGSLCFSSPWHFKRFSFLSRFSHLHGLCSACYCSSVAWGRPPTLFLLSCWVFLYTCDYNHRPDQMTWSLCDDKEAVFLYFSVQERRSWRVTCGTYLCRLAFVCLVPLASWLHHSLLMP